MNDTEDNCENQTKDKTDLKEFQLEFDEFCRIIAHDLKAPFRQIEAYMTIIKSHDLSGLDDQSSDYLNRIQNISARGVTLLEAISTFSKITRDNHPIELVKTEALIEGVKERLAPELSEYRGELTIGSLPDLMGEVDNLNMVFYELLRNSLIYQSPKRPSKITLTAQQQGSVVVFTLEDNGMGFPGRDLDVYFNIFKRGVSDKKHPGLGMGLAYARRICQKHSGSINIKESDDEGSTLSFTLPAG